MFSVVKFSVGHGRPYVGQWSSRDDKFLDKDEKS